ncbi:MAG: FlgO family outer membrane protein [Spartobacteria bacterium]
MRTFLQELKRRRVYRVALAYAIAGSGVVQLAGTVLPMFHAPNWMERAFVVAIALGFPVALVLGWIYDLRGSGLYKTATPVAGSGTEHRRVIALALTGLSVTAIVLISYWIWYPQRQPPQTTAVTNPAAIPDKSIAVLPFANLGEGDDDEHFAEGIHDEILTDLARVADLRVISRTSVMQYRSGSERNLREIAKALGAAHVVEGTVQRQDNRVRISAQLIDARTDTHIWADRYERDVSDVFALESELAETIVAQLTSKLSQEEKIDIETKPTTSFAAYDLYRRANSLLSTIVFNTRSKSNLFEVVSLLDRAVSLDPSFFLAYCRLARAHDQIYLLALDHTPARLALANSAVQSALRLHPNSGEARLALAQHLYCGYLDYDRAREELQVARKLLPNESLIPELLGYIDRRQGRWMESERDLKDSLALDPRNAFLYQQLALTYNKMRQYPQMAEALDRALALIPEDTGTRVQRAAVELDWHANSKPLHSVIEALLVTRPEATGDLAQAWFLLAACERNWKQMAQAVAAMPENGCREEGVAFPHGWCEGVAARFRGDENAARASFSRARQEQAEIVSQQPNYPEAVCVLAVIDAALGRKDEAIEEGRRAAGLLPVSKDSINGPILLNYLAVIYAWVGENDQALDQLRIAARTPGDLSYGQLRLHPFWDALRDDPRFDEIVATLAPRDGTTSGTH